MLDHVGEDNNHVLLKCGSCVTQPEGHFPESEVVLQACESGLLLVLEGVGNFVVPGVAIEEAIVLVDSELIEHLIDEWEREEFFSGGGVELLVIHVDLETGDCASRDELVVVVFITVMMSFFGMH